MRSLDAARAVCEQFHPGLLKEIEQIPYTGREQSGGPVVDLFRIHGGVGLLIPAEYGGLGAAPLDALRVQLALGALSPSLVAAVSMHHFTVAMLYSLAGKTGRLTPAQTGLLRRIVPEQQVMASGWAEGRTAQNVLAPAVTARPVDGGYLLSGAKKPCSLSGSMSLLTASVAIHHEDGSAELALALVPADAPGLSVHPFWGNELLAGAESDEVRLADVFVPADMVVRAGADDPHRLDDLQTAGFVWFEMLISAGYAGAAAALVEQVLERERGSVQERAALAVETEAALALLEGVARAIGPETDEESVARVLVARYTVQKALPRIAGQALELLGGLDFILGSPHGRIAAAVQALAFHPPGRGAAAEPLLRYFDGGPLVLSWVTAPRAASGGPHHTWSETSVTVIQEAPVDTEAEILGLYRAHLSKGRATLAELFGSHMETSSEGAWLTTSDGERFLNAGGYGVFIMGARHPIVMEEVERQLRTHPTATRILLEPTVARAAEALVSVLPEGLDRVHFALSGAEAVETGLKLARAGGRKRTVSMRRGYHGKTLGALSATAKDVYQAPFRPLIPDFLHLPFGETEELEAELAAHPGEVCVILEPVQGEGGVIIPPAGYLKRVEELVRAYDGFLILDEVQSGFGRLGEWWGADTEGVVPDVLLTGKALGGGVLPVSAAVATRKAFRPFDKDPYVHTATFSGQPVLMAAVQGAIRAMKEERLVTRAMDLGARLLPRIAEIAYRNIPELVVDVRGRGLLIGVELVEAGLAGELLIELFNHGVVANHSMNGSSVVRFTPPAVMSDTDVEFLLNSFALATRDLVRGAATMPKGGN